ncbi:hypothetical protein I4F81_012486 [Pyropia yezoensis]|uniref:Uncharacterized protein n=1 Tax=Pyropia yezoensis TaxID=2788 RepID=A0ACC3CIT2_PYRYE|nr:hypothetical protein I4F81_012486 [Neopyropia yezoensis]
MFRYVNRALAATLAVVTVAAAAAAAPAAAQRLDVPRSPVSIDVAESVLSSLDESVDPCVDAYEWACGGWRAANSPPPQALSSISTFRSIQTRVDDAVDVLLRSPTLAATKPGVFYTSCTAANVEPSDLAPLARLRPALASLTGANASVETAVGAVAALAGAGVESAVWEFGVISNPQRVGGRALLAMVPEFTAAEPAFSATTPYGKAVRAAYNKLLLAMAGTAVEAGLLPPTASGGKMAAEEVAAAAAAFEARLVNYSGVAPMTAAAVKAGKASLADAFFLIDSRRLATSRAAVGPPGNPIRLVEALVSAVTEDVGVTLPGNIRLVTPPAYARALDAWLTAATAPDGGGLLPLQAYLAVAATRAYAELDLLGTLPRASLEPYAAVVYGVTAPGPLLTRCVRRAGRFFPTEVGTAFAGAHLPASNKTFAVAMAEDVRAATGRLVDRADWLDTPTRAVVREKLAAMAMRVGDATPPGGAEDTSGVVVDAVKQKADRPALCRERCRTCAAFRECPRPPRRSPRDPQRAAVQESKSEPSPSHHHPAPRRSGTLSVGVKGGRGGDEQSACDANAKRSPS